MFYVAWHLIEQFDTNSTKNITPKMIDNNTHTLMGCSQFGWRRLSICCPVDMKTKKKKQKKYIINEKASFKRIHNDVLLLLDTAAFVRELLYLLIRQTNVFFFGHHLVEEYVDITNNSNSKNNDDSKNSGQQNEEWEHEQKAENVHSIYAIIFMSRYNNWFSTEKTKT